jgi:hypothetical protein
MKAMKVELDKEYLQLSPLNRPELVLLHHIPGRFVFNVHQQFLDFSGQERSQCHSPVKIILSHKI